ncbi:RNA-directed DNA polymerase from mobile element jockey-like, partial [Paramuricea clavata]
RGIAGCFGAAFTKKRARDALFSLCVVIRKLSLLPEGIYFYDPPNLLQQIYKSGYKRLNLSRLAFSRQRSLTCSKSQSIVIKDISRQNLNALALSVCEIKKLINTRDRSKRKAIIKNLEADWLVYKQTRNKVNIEMKKAKKDYYSKRIAGQKQNPKEAWKTMNNLLGRQNKPTKVNELSISGNNLTNSEDIAEGFNEFFSNIGPDLASKIDTSNHNFQEYIKKPKSEFTVFESITTNKVYYLLRGLSSAKATGIDKISSKILKLAAPAISSSLTYIFNQAITLCTFPDEWKMARVSPLYKNGQKNLPGNYRPISVLPAVSKVMERILYDQLYDYLTKFELLNDCQFGFRKSHSTATALLDCTNSWYMNIDKKLFNLVVLIDLKKAFDTGRRPPDFTKKTRNLWRKRRCFGSILKSYLITRTQKCQVNGTISSERLIKCGVPQGSILGPLFFLLYINDLPQCLSKTKPRLFADDTNLTAAGESINDVEAAMNSDLENFRKWLIANKLSLNVAKTEFILIGSKPMITSISNKQPNIIIENKPIKQVYDCKTLGVTVDQHLSCKNNTETICKKITSGISALRQIKEFVEKDTLVSVYNSIVRLYFTYCCEVWDVFDILNFIVNPPSDTVELVMEVTDKTRADVKGGTLIEYENKVRLLEIAQVPKHHVDEFKSVSKFRIFNTNNLWVRLAAIQRLLDAKKMHMEVIVNNKNLENGYNVIQLETAVGAAIKNFDGALGINVPRSRFLPVKKISDLLLVKSNLYITNEAGALMMSPKRQFATTPLIQLVAPTFGSFIERFQTIPDILELDHLTVSGDVTFGKGVTLKGTVIIIANHGERIDGMAGALLENKIVSGNLRILDH